MKQVWRLGGKLDATRRSITRWVGTRIAVTLISCRGANPVAPFHLPISLNTQNKHCWTPLVRKPVCVVTTIVAFIDKLFCRVHLVLLSVLIYTFWRIISPIICNNTMSFFRGLWKSSSKHKSKSKFSFNYFIFR